MSPSVIFLHMYAEPFCLICHTDVFMLQTVRAFIKNTPLQESAPP